MKWRISAMLAYHGQQSPQFGNIVRVRQHESTFREIAEEPRLPRVVFTPHLAKHLDVPPQTVSGDTVREVLEQVFEHNPRLRGYILDDQSALRQHVTLFVDSSVVRDRRRLTDPVPEDGEVYVMQALSGG